MSGTIKLPVSKTETLHVEVIDDRPYYTVHADGCPSYLVNSIEEAVDFVHPRNSLKQKLSQTYALTFKILQHLNK